MKTVANLNEYTTLLEETETIEQKLELLALIDTTVTEIKNVLLKEQWDNINNK